MKLLLAAPFVLLVAGCKNPAPGYTPVPPPPVASVDLASLKSAKDLMPLDVGNVWKYALHSQALDSNGNAKGEANRNAEIEIESRWPDGTAVIVFRVDGNIVDRQAWHAEPNGLYQVEGGIESISVRPPMPLFPIPLKASRAFEWKGRSPSLAGRSSASSEAGEILAPQKVDTTAGAVSAVPVVSHTVYVDGRNDGTTWFQPGVGIVRMQQEIRSKTYHSLQTYTLTSHTTKS